MVKQLDAGVPLTSSTFIDGVYVAASTESGTVRIYDLRKAESAVSVLRSVVEKLHGSFATTPPTPPTPPKDMVGYGGIWWDMLGYNPILWDMVGYARIW